jgi:hypothetical protein
MGLEPTMISAGVQDRLTVLKMFLNMLQNQSCFTNTTVPADTNQPILPINLRKQIPVKGRSSRQQTIRHSLTQYRNILYHCLVF